MGRQVDPKSKRRKIRVALPAARVRIPILNKVGTGPLTFVGWWTQEVARNTSSFVDTGVTFTVNISPEGYADALHTNEASVSAVEATTGFLAKL